MGIFKRSQKPQPSNKMLPPPPENKVQPEPAKDETPPTAMRLRYCSNCDTLGARHRIRVGYWYLNGTLPHVYLCDACQEAAQQKERQHHTSQKKTLTETKAIKPKESA